MFAFPLARLEYTAIADRRVSTVCLATDDYEVGVSAPCVGWETHRFDTLEEAQAFHAAEVARLVEVMKAPSRPLTREGDR